jgi:hypothetical protein
MNIFVPGDYADAVNIFVPPTFTDGVHVFIVEGEGTLDVNIDEQAGEWILTGPEFPVSAEHTVTWTTNEPSTYVVDYGLTTGYGGQVIGDVLNTIHSALIIGLDPSTLYHYRVSATDASDNTRVGTDETFTTVSS